MREDRDGGGSDLLSEFECGAGVLVRSRAMAAWGFGWGRGVCGLSRVATAETLELTGKWK